MHLGFDHCGIAKAGFLEEESIRLEEWLHKRMQGGMGYMVRNREKRLDPRLLVPGARSVISLMMNYYPAKKQQEHLPQISKYAYGEDYHFVIWDKLNELLVRIQKMIGDVQGRGFTDSAPVMERAWAVRSGLGWIGKNSNLINKTSGSFLLLAELIVDVELEYDSPVRNYCGSCTKCIDACPTGAITKAYVVDGSRCISYFTIESKEEIPKQYRNKIGNHLFGCDICQNVCPWNRFAKSTQEPKFQALPGLLNMTMKDWLGMSKEEFNQRFAKSALQRSGYEGIFRNVKFISEKIILRESHAGKVKHSSEF